MMSRLLREGEFVQILTVAGEGMLELWYPMGQGRRMGRGHGRHHGGLKGGRRQGMRGQDRLLLRVRVPLSRADALVGPARTALAMSGAVGLAMLALGLLLYRWAARAGKAEQKLHRQRALSALGEMAAVLAHEIRTPLASIKGNSQLLGESFPDDQRALDVVREAARMERLVNGMLDFARPPEPRLAACEPDRVLTRAAGLVAPRAAARGVSIITEPSGRSEPLLADEDQLLQALVNLLNNAVEATPAGAPAGEVVTIGVKNQGREVVCRVQDRGAGLAGAELATLARPFFSGRDRGSGLGLSVARRVVEGHGGILTLVEREGGGAVAQVRLPRGRSREQSR